MHIKSLFIPGSPHSPFFQITCRIAESSAITLVILENFQVNSKNHPNTLYITNFAMQLFTSLTFAFGLVASTLAVQTVHLTFHGGPAQYSMAFPADGTVYPTNNGIAVSIIDAPDYNAQYQCNFITAGQKTLAGSITSTGLQQILVGPPQPITGVSCLGMCIGTYGDCYVNGQYVGPCCSGYCAANKCRPWVNPF
ncbi:hypothetical protein B0H66DRAFT_569546 [Apodospora peruviana]|uniref:Uncharacterized protein n=1 Tax=Apodospora peruviana TaxID=516989 RepID=A0AAE0LZ57_9PEZI|nr:hypothetical protein B0H66DRAFT_569546 [Apodospora peruviana]